MRRILCTTFLSLDGVMQAPGGKGEDPSGGFDLEGWSVNYWDDLMGQEMGAFMTPPFDLLIGRKTYEIFSAYWPNASEEEGAGPLNAATKYVVSNSLTNEGATWGPSVVIGGDVVGQIRRIKQEDGPDLQVHGSSNLLQTLIGNNLIDQYHLMTFPVVLGRGKRLFADGAIPAGLQLIESKLSTTGIVIATYMPAGEVKLGTFGSDQAAAPDTVRG